MSKSTQKLEAFIEPQDPGNEKLSEDQEREAYGEFCGFVDDILLNHMDAFLKDNKTGEPVPTVHLRTSEKHDDGRYDSSLEAFVSSEVDENGVMTRSVQLNDQTRKGTTRWHKYIAKEGSGEVTRHDEYFDRENNEGHNDDDSPTERERMLSGDTDPKPLDMEKTLKGLARLVESANNYDLELQMGFNGQPVGPDEVNDLKEFVISMSEAEPGAW